MFLWHNQCACEIRLYSDSYIDLSLRKNKRGKRSESWILFLLCKSIARQVRNLIYFHMQEVFCQLPLPYVEEEFKIDMTWKDSGAKDDLPSYAHIRRSILHSFIISAITT